MTYVSPLLDPAKHCFFDRFGGVSSGLYDSLNFNVKSQDSKDNIQANIEIVAQKFGLTSNCVALIFQNISSDAIYVDTPSQFQFHADGMVTKQKNIILGITTADCAPVMFADYQNQVIGIAHAGWRGAVKGIMENTLQLMLEHGACKNNIIAVIGPCLQKPSFECKADMHQEFMAQDTYNQTFFTATDNEHYQFDSAEYLIHRLNKFGITNVSSSTIDTYTDEAYFSYRRNTHRQLIGSRADFPIQLSTIML